MSTPNETPQVVYALVELCQEMGITHVLQVGAGDGYEAWKIHEETGAVPVAIEADMRVSPINGQIEFHYAAISNNDGIGPFFWMNSLGLSGEIRRESEKAQREQAIHKSRLDTFCARHKIKPDCLLIDTEGSAFEVIDGAGNLLDGVRLIYAECQTGNHFPGNKKLGEINEYLLKRGFVQRGGLPAYDGGAQGNYTWIKSDS